MKRFLEKIGKKRGSVLFLVLSMMSLMIVLASAVYYSVVTAQKTQLTDLYDEQAYQSALSVSDVLTQYLTHGNKNDGIMKMVYDLDTAGESITTGSNDFAAFGAASGQEQLARIGAFKSTITYLGKYTGPGDKDIMEYDVAVTTNYNGIEETVHTIMTYYEQKADAPSFDKFFTATGYSTGDVYIENGFIASDAFFDNEYTMIRKGYNLETVIDPYWAGGNKNKYDANTGGGQVAVWGSIWCGGSLNLENDVGRTRQSTKPIDIIVYNNLDYNKCSDLIQDMKGGSIFVGGNAHFNDATVDGVNTIYVLGDVVIDGNFQFNNINQVFVGGNLTINNSCNKTFYVNGDLINRVGNGAKVYCKNNLTGDNSNVIATGTDNNWNQATGVYDTKVKVALSGELVEYKDYRITTQGIKDFLDTILVKDEYPQWNPENGDVDAEIDFKLTKDDGGNYTYNHSIYVITQSCTINDITLDDTDAWDDNHAPTVVIYNPSDTDSLVVTLKGNCKYEGQSTFSWAGGDNSSPTFQNVNVIVVGEGPVLIELDGDTKYIQNDFDFIGHLGFYSILSNHSNGRRMLKADVIRLENEAKAYTGTCGFITDDTLFTVKINNVFHEYEQNFQNHVEYESISSNFVYSYSQRHQNAGTSCGKVDENGECDHMYCLNVANVQGKFSSLYIPDDMHNNIFLISTAVDADFNFYGDCGFLGGYIYAPYMRYDSSEYTGTEYTIAIAGGMIVSDYCINDNRGYLFIKCEANLANLAGFNQGDPLQPTTSRVWKRTTY